MTGHCPRPGVPRGEAVSDLYSARRLRFQPDLACNRPCLATPKICPRIHSLHGLPFGISGQSSSLKGRSTGLCFGVVFGGGMTAEAGFTSDSLDSNITSDKAMRHNDLRDLAQRCRLIAGKADAFTKRRLLNLAAQYDARLEGPTKQPGAANSVFQKLYPDRQHGEKNLD